MTSPREPPVFASMKRDVFQSAREVAIDVALPDGERVGSLVPVGRWILNRADLIGGITDWRQRWMRMFYSQFVSTPERTKGYLEKLAIGSPTRLMFMVYDDAERAIGHLAVMDNSDGTGDFDNVVRGIGGGHPRLIEIASRTLMDWCFQQMGWTVIYGRVMTYNRPIRSLLKTLGYEEQGPIYLRAEQEGDTLYHRPVEQADSNVDYTSTKYALARSEEPRED